MADEQKSGDAAPAKSAGTDEKPAGDPKPAADAKPEPKADEKPEAKADEKKPDEKPADTPAGKDGAPKEEPKAPEKYELTIPEGGELWLDAADLKQLETIARKEGLTNEAAQQFVTDHVAALAEQSQAFRAQVQADETYGGDRFPDTERHVRLVLDKVRPAGTPQGDAFRALLSKTGYGNKLEVVAFLADLGKTMAEDTPARGGGGPGGVTRDAATVLYGESKGS
jgi:hypothetical protein